MTVADELLRNAKRYASEFDKGDLPLPPARKVAIDDEIRSLAISQRLLGTEEIVLIHHTDCGMLTFTDDDFKRQPARGRLRRRAG
jgi:carbonic anhydrase